MNIVKDWTTLELIEFLNSYNRLEEEDTYKYTDLYVVAFAELNKRQPLMSLIY